MKAPGRGQVLQVLAVLAAGVASYATPAPAPPLYVYPRAYPAWEVVEGERQALGCASAEVWVSKSGKDGLGVTVRMSAQTTEPCALTFQGAEVRVGREGEAPLIVRADVRAVPIGLTTDNATFLYLAFPFDNEAAWNAGRDEATLTVLLRANDAAPVTWAAALRQGRPGPHREVENPVYRDRFGAPPGGYW